MTAVRTDTLLDICDRLSDEGDRVFLGSTNDADVFRRIARGDPIDALLQALRRIQALAEDGAVALKGTGAGNGFATIGEAARDALALAAGGPS